MPHPPLLAQETQNRRLRQALAGAPSPVLSGATTCDISWYGPKGGVGTEATIQAASGLMEVHGWDFGGPRRLGIEVASVAAGIVGACGTLAALVGTNLGRPYRRVETSVLAAGLLLVAHHIAAATAEGEPLPSPPGPDPGPPFATADGRWFEIEVFEPDSWAAFWDKLGAGNADLGRGWTAFRHRYYRGRCTLPAGLHAATRDHTLSEVAAVARVCGVSLCPVRGYGEVLADPGWSGPAVTFAPGDPAKTFDPGDPAKTFHPGNPTDTASGARRSVPGAAVGLPLEGIGVVEATNRMQGPLAGLLLQLLGAQVTRVEPPGGDVGRMVPPECDGTSSFFQCFNRGKRSVELDLTSPSGRRDLLKLMADADVFLHNWRPGRAEAWHLDQPVAAAANPGLVYAAASGWGPTGGLDGVIGTDFLVQAHAGFGEGLNPAGEPPRTSRVLLADCLGALCTCEAILAGLYLREAAGAGNILARPSLLEGALAAQAHILDSLGKGGKRGGRSPARPQWSRLDGPLPTSTGEQIVVGVEEGAARDQLAQICSCSPSASDDVLVEAVSRRPAGYWMEELAAAQIPCARVVRELAWLPAEPGMARYFFNLSATCRGPASPWSFA